MSNLVMCYCGKNAIRKISSQSSKNPGRPYYSCPMKEPCRFFMFDIISEKEDKEGVHFNVIAVKNDENLKKMEFIFRECEILKEGLDIKIENLKEGLDKKIEKLSNLQKEILRGLDLFLEVMDLISRSKNGDEMLNKLCEISYRRKNIKDNQDECTTPILKSIEDVNDNQEMKDFKKSFF